MSLRTLRRDVETLRELGYPVHASGGRTSTYALGAGSVLPPLVLDGEQAVAISLALQTSPTTVLGLRDAADRALNTLATLMSAPLRAQVDATRITVLRNFWEFSAPPIAPAVLEAVGQALRRSHLLRVDVLRPDGSRPAPPDPDFVAPVVLEPHHLVLWAGRWYLVGHLPHTGGAVWQIFRVDRLHVHDTTGRTFERRQTPYEDVGEYVVSHWDRGDTPAAWQCSGSAVMPLPAAVVARWAPGGSVVEHVDAAHARLTVGAWSWAGIAGIMATFDAPLAQVEPVELRHACRELADRMGRVAVESIVPG